MNDAILPLSERLAALFADSGISPDTLREFIMAVVEVAGYVCAPAPPDPATHFRDLLAGARQAAAALRAIGDQGYPLDIWPLEDGHTTPADVLRVLDELARWADVRGQGVRGRPCDMRRLQAVRGIAAAFEMILGIPATATKGNLFEAVLADVLEIGSDRAHSIAKKFSKWRQG